VLCVESFVLRALPVRLLGKIKTSRGVRKVAIPVNCL